MMFNTTSVENHSHLTSAKLKESYSLAVLTAFCVGIYCLRVYLSGSYFLLFLIWNLFLAFVPWVISTVLLLSARMQKLKLLSVVFLLLWVVFFPNAPYIITDLVHLQHSREMPFWFDLIVILSFAWTGLLYGFSSLRDISVLCKRKLNFRLVNTLIAGFMFVTSFGVYIGRYLRWNSWDIISKPMELIADILEIIINPVAHPKAWGMTLLMGLMLNIIYWTFRPLRHKNV